MNEHISRLRGPKILRLLYEQGPLSLKGLSDIFKIKGDPIKPRRLRESVERLHKHRLIVPRFDSLPQNAGNYYQLSLRKEIREHIAFIIGTGTIDEIREPMIRDQELTHSEQCAIWATRFQQAFPDSRVIREYLFSSDDTVLGTLSSKPFELQLRPDLLLMITENNQGQQVDIAIEVERSRKTNERLFQKLEKLVVHSQLSGVLYICSEDSIAEAVRRNYQRKAVRKNMRTNHYGANFLLFTDGKTHTKNGELLVLTSELKPIPFSAWIRYLRTTDYDYRRNDQPLLTAEPGWRPEALIS
jgi:hypothetical protein